jgi:hypothetical protein
MPDITTSSDKQPEKHHPKLATPAFWRWKRAVLLYHVPVIPPQRASGGLSYCNTRVTPWQQQAGVTSVCQPTHHVEDVACRLVLHDADGLQVAQTSTHAPGTQVTDVIIADERVGRDSQAATGHILSP